MTDGSTEKKLSPFSKAKIVFTSYGLLIRFREFIKLRLKWRRSTDVYFSLLFSCTFSDICKTYKHVDHAEQTIHTTTAPSEDRVFLCLKVTEWIFALILMIVFNCKKVLKKLSLCPEAIRGVWNLC